MDTVVHMLSKPSLFHFFFLSLLFFPFLHSLTCLIYSPFHLQWGLWAPQTKRTEEEERRSSNKGEWEKRGDAEKHWDREQAALSEMTHTYAGTQGPLFGGFAAGPCDHIDWVWWTCGPSFFLSHPFISSRLVSWWRNGSRGNRKSYSDFFWGSYHDSLRCQGSEYWLAYWPGRGSKKAGEVQVQDFFVKLNAGHLETDVWKQRNTPRIWKKGRTAVLWI